MKHSLKNLTGYAMGAVDGEIGKVKDFYFDDESWTIRYLIVETGNWLSGRKVLISPESVITPDYRTEVFQVNLTKEQIKNSPDIDTEKPVSRQQEMKLYEHYPWTSYWGGGLWAGGIGTTGMMTRGAEPIRQSGMNEEYLSGNESVDDHHLRSTDTVKGYNIKATDGEIGDVEDFIIDDSSWKIRFLIVDTGNWFPGKQVLIAPDWIREINWQTATVIVNASVDRIKNSPEYDAGQELSDSYEANLQNYYGRITSR